MLRQRRGFSNYPLSEQRKSQPEYQLPSRINEALMSEEITIKFVGDMEENIEQIIGNLRCAQQTRQQVRSILRIYAAKVSKLREQRNFYKELLFIREEKDTFQINRLKKQLEQLKQSKERLVSKGNCQRCTCFQESHFRTSKFSQSGQDNQLSRATVHSFCSHPLSKHYPSACLPPRESIPCEDQMLISSKSSHCVADSLQVSETLKQALEDDQYVSSRCNATITEEQLTRLMLKYNISTEELQQIFQEYDRENKQAFQLFDSSRQRQLYKLGQRMQKDLWNRKIVKDIRKMSDLKPL